MPPISTPHSLFGPTTAAPGAGAAPASQSGYCYLFPDLARRADVGCFRGATPTESFQRLKTFEKDSRTALSTPQVLPMRLAAVYTYFGQFVNHDISAPVGDVVTLADPPEGTGVIDTGLPPGLDRVRRASPEGIVPNFVNEQAEPLALDSASSSSRRSWSSSSRTRAASPSASITTPARPTSCGWTASP